MAAAEFMSMAAVPEPPALPTNAYNTSTWNAERRRHDQPLNLERFCVWYACQDTLMQAMFRHYHVTVHRSGRPDEWMSITPKPQLCMQAGYWGQLCHEMCDDHRCSRCSQQEGGYSFFSYGTVGMSAVEILANPAVANDAKSPAVANNGCLLQ